MFPQTYFCQVPPFPVILLHALLIPKNFIKSSLQSLVNGGRDCYPRLPIVHQIRCEKKVEIVNYKKFSERYVGKLG